MENIKTLVKEVLEKGYLMSLATHDDGGVWVSDVSYIHNDELKIYWRSQTGVRHSKAILQNKKVAGTITANNPGEDNLGIQFEGIAEKIEGSRPDLMKIYCEKRKKPIMMEEEDIAEGRSWYVLKPLKIELIYEKLFGFNKQKLELNHGQ